MAKSKGAREASQGREKNKNRVDKNLKQTRKRGCRVGVLQMDKEASRGEGNKGGEI